MNEKLISLTSSSDVSQVSNTPNLIDMYEASEALKKSSGTNRSASSSNSTTRSTPTEFEENQQVLADDKDEVKLENVPSLGSSSPKEQIGEQETHDHLLPPGWVCFYDMRNKSYRFEPKNGLRSHKDQADIVDDVVQTSRRPTLYSYECKYGYHFPESPTPSMISELTKLVDSRAQAQAKKQTSKLGEIQLGENQGELMKSLQEMFPTATSLTIEQMIKLYQGREGLIKAALISSGYKRAGSKTRTADVQDAIVLMMAKPSSKKLFDKLVSYFPDKDEINIKKLMYDLKEVEHDIISALVNSSKVDRMSSRSWKPHHRSESQRERDKNGAIMKLRYLRYLFPQCEEIDLYYLLYCNDLRVQAVVEELEKRGHVRANIDEAVKNRLSGQPKSKSQPAKHREQNVAATLIEKHKSRPRRRLEDTRVKTIVENISKQKPVEHSPEIIEIALRATDFEENLAKKFLEELSPIDEDAYKRRHKISIDDDSKIVYFPCKGTQKSESGLYTFTLNETVGIPRDTLECQNALALIKCDASTWTQDDMMSTKIRISKGRNLDIIKGSAFNHLEKNESIRRGRLESLHQRPKKITQTENRPSTRLAKGPNLDLRRSVYDCNRQGRNPRLLERIHPFFKD